jgi:hypothetical protein
MKNMLFVLCVLFLAASLNGCASKINRYYIGQCAIPGHWFCGKSYDKYADCNMDRKRHDYETSMTGSCHSGRKDGQPDYRTM